MKERNGTRTVTAGTRVNLNEEEEEEKRNDTQLSVSGVSQLTGLESARQSIPPLSFSLAGPASMALSITGSRKLSTALDCFNGESE